MELKQDGLANLGIFIACLNEWAENGEEAAKKMAERLKAGLPGKESNEKAD
jgi:hypothetical protein